MAGGLCGSPWIIFGRTQQFWGIFTKKLLRFLCTKKPRGADFMAAQEMGLSVHHALSLPGRVAPLSAAMAIRDTAYNILREEGII